MNKYEILYIIPAHLEDDQKNATVEKYETLANSLGTVLDLDKWGIRKFAYVMDKQTEGYYVLMSFEAPATVPQMLESQMLIMEGVVRHMVTFKN